MADACAVEGAYATLGGDFGLDTARLVPIVYMNSDSHLKAFCGRSGGLVCTSSNAVRAFAWGLERGDRVFFFPDEHLGRNSARELGLAPEEVALWDPFKERGGLDAEAVKRARLLIWKGHCHVHTAFRPEHVEQARAAHPAAIVVVHPECPEEVVRLADLSGSTRKIVDVARGAPAGSTIVIGTEIHLVERLALELAGEKTVLPLARSLCPNMAKISLEKLLRTLERLDGDAQELEVEVEVADGVRHDARIALQRMLEIA
jgi:quinolinate synthase